MTSDPRTGALPVWGRPGSPLRVLEMCLEGIRKGSQTRDARVACLYDKRFGVSRKTVGRKTSFFRRMNGPYKFRRGRLRADLNPGQCMDTCKMPMRRYRRGPRHYVARKVNEFEKNRPGGGGGCKGKRTRAGPASFSLSLILWPGTAFSPRSG